MFKTAVDKHMDDGLVLHFGEYTYDYGNLQSTWRFCTFKKTRFLFKKSDTRQLKIKYTLYSILM